MKSTSCSNGASSPELSILWSITVLHIGNMSVYQACLNTVMAVGALDRDTGPPVQQQQLRQQGIILLVCSGLLADRID